MKTFAARFILFYSTILAIFIVVSGILTLKSIEQALFQLAFLPVALYLLFTMGKEIKRMIKKQEPSSHVSLSGRKTEFIAGIIIFIALLIIGVKNLSSTSSAQNTRTETKENTVKSAESDPIVFEKKEESGKNLVVKITDGSPSVNLRSGPGTFHDILGEAEDGQEFTYFDEDQGWYKIDFDGQEAWIYENYVSIEEENE